MLARVWKIGQGGAKPQPLAQLCCWKTNARMEELLQQEHCCDWNRQNTPTNGTFQLKAVPRACEEGIKQHRVEVDSDSDVSVHTLSSAVVTKA